MSNPKVEMSCIFKLLIFIYVLAAFGITAEENKIDHSTIDTEQNSVDDSNIEEIEELQLVNSDRIDFDILPNLNEQSKEDIPLYPVPVSDESLAVDGDLVRAAYGNPQLDITRMDVLASNVTINVNSSLEASSNVTKFRCTCNTGKENGGQPVELVNSTRLLNILVTDSNVTNRKTSADCVALMFYGQCSFSAMAAPHFNALFRAFPDIKMAAVDAMKFHSFNTQYGIVGVPTIMLFHNGRPIAKFNDSEYTLELFAKFITKNTGIEADIKQLFVMSADFGGPVSSVPTKETDYCLALSWVFIIICGVYFFSKSAYWKWIVETAQNTWRESEAQHEHAE